MVAVPPLRQPMGNDVADIVGDEGQAFARAVLPDQREQRQETGFAHGEERAADAAGREVLHVTGCVGQRHQIIFRNEAIRFFGTARKD